MASLSETAGRQFFLLFVFIRTVLSADWNVCSEPEEEAHFCTRERKLIKIIVIRNDHEKRMMKNAVYIFNNSRIGIVVLGTI